MTLISDIIDEPIADAHALKLSVTIIQPVAASDAAAHEIGCNLS